MWLRLATLCATLGRTSPLLLSRCPGHLACRRIQLKHSTNSEKGDGIWMSFYGRSLDVRSYSEDGMMKELVDPGQGGQFLVVSGRARSLCRLPHRRNVRAARTKQTYRRSIVYPCLLGRVRRLGRRPSSQPCASNATTPSVRPDMGHTRFWTHI